MPWPTVALALSLGLSVGWVALQTPAPSGATFALDPPSPPLQLQARAEALDLPMPPGVPAAHASSLLQLRGERGDLLAAWFAGTRESGADVQIWMARFDASTSRWSAPQAVLDRHALSKGRLGFGIRRLGNPVLWQDVGGRIHLFVVATGLGGWAASRVLQATLRSSSGGYQVADAQVLPLSPLWNISTLVRTNAVALTDGGALLPLYFELGLKYPMALRLDPQGRWISAVRLSSQRGGLQPAVVPTSATQALALMRDFDAKAVRAAHTSDTGRSWSDLPAAPVPNSNSSVAALRLPDGSLLMAANPLTDGRHELALLRSRDGLQWRREATLERSKMGDEYSYPALCLGQNGRVVHVSYTWQRQRIRHRVFDLTPMPP
jgi:predicted neuraminidase